jgi:hypothetical protein
MSWRLMEDAANPENRNAGNGGDLIKHTVYLATIQFLAERKPWSEGLFVRECHAGRGMYRVVDEARRRRLGCLYSDPSDVGGPILLQSAQRGVLNALRCWPNVGEPIECYAGSALINAFALGDHPGACSLDLYECLPETRQILRAVIIEAEPCIPVSVLPVDEQGQEFDGEDYIKAAVGRWGNRDLILLDPFAMWRQAEHQPQRDRYGTIIDRLIARGGEAPSLILFWTWGRHFPAADGDLDGTAEPVRHGYSNLRGKLHEAGLHLVIVKWRWELQFAIWVVLPEAHITAFREDIDLHCRLLTDHLTRNGYGLDLSHPLVEID